jgi:cobalt/nickel transport system permease protein
MHMANELLSVPTAVGTCAVAGAGLAYVCRRLGRILTPEKWSLMGILGAFVFAAQMINIQLPGMPGTSGHLIGAVLLAIVLGPAAAILVMSSVVIVQCLIFQDGGLLALGCNILNMAIVPCLLGHVVYKAAACGSPGRLRLLVAAFAASLVGVEAGAAMVPMECGLAGVLVVPLRTFLVTLLAVHLLVGLLEGLLTASIVAYLGRVRPDLICLPGTAVLSRRTVLATFLAGAVLCGGGLSLLASRLPDGLEWTLLARPDQPDFQPMISRESPQVVAAADRLASKIAPLPNDSAGTAPIGEVACVESSGAPGWTSLAGVTGSLLTMGLVWLGARAIGPRRGAGRWSQGQANRPAGPLKTETL